MHDDSALSMKDRILGVLAMFSALYCFAVSLNLALPTAKTRFLVALGIFVVCFSLVRPKKGVAIAIVAFVALRFAWAAIVSLLQH
jgi:hypothetical protein